MGKLEFLHFFYIFLDILWQAGVRIHSVSLVASQPWPIGRAGSCELMLACKERAELSWAELSWAEYRFDMVLPFTKKFKDAQRRSKWNA